MTTVKIAEDTTTPTTTQGQGAKAPKKAKKAATPKEPKAPKAPKAKKEKPARSAPAHMVKVNKIAAQLPQLSVDAAVLFAAVNNMSTADMNSLVQHINVSIRRRGVTAMAQGRVGKLEPGNRVRIVSGDTRFLGQEGVVSKVQRIRCYVRIDGRNKDDYFFCSDVVSSAATAPQGSLHDVVSRLSSIPPVLDMNTIEDEEDTLENESSATG
jgi:hypothetical protein